VYDAFAKALPPSFATYPSCTPLVHRYDAFVVQGWKLLRKDSGFSLKGALFACVGFCVFLPSIVLTLCDAAEAIETVGDGGPGARVMEAAADDVNKLAARQANQEAVTEIETRAEEKAVALFVTAGDERRARDAKEGGAVASPSGTLSGTEHLVLECARKLRLRGQRGDGGRACPEGVQLSVEVDPLENESHALLGLGSQPRSRSHRRRGAEPRLWRSTSEPAAEENADMDRAAEEREHATGRLESRLATC
jgi:hypothetical protein